MDYSPWGLKESDVTEQLTLTSKKNLMSLRAPIKLVNNRTISNFFPRDLSRPWHLEDHGGHAVLVCLTVGLPLSIRSSNSGQRLSLRLCLQSVLDT